MPMPPLLLTFALFSAAASPPIVLDGLFDDWKDTKPAVVDPADAASSPVDFRSVHVDHDHEYVYLKVDFGNMVNVQGLQGRAVMFLDVDGDPRSGRDMQGLRGVDIAIEFTPQNTRNPERPGMGIGVQSATYQPDPNDETAQQIGPYDIGLGMAPTYASREVEFRIERGSRLPRTPVLFRGPQFGGKLVFFDVAGNVLDQTDAFTHQLKSVEPRSFEMPNDPIARANGTQMRIVTWNAEHGSLVENPDPFSNVLKALNPDIVLWQELTDENSADQIAAWMNQHVGSRDTNTGLHWNVVFAEGGGNLRTAVASRLPIEAVQQVHFLPYRDIPDRQVRVVGAAVTVAGKKLLVVSAHLKCCGAMETRDDRLRFVEARMINNAVRDALEEGNYDGVVIGGDLNLVGERNVMVVLGNALDNNDSLKVVDAMQLDGTTNVTWSQSSQPFVPSRLDYLLYSQSTLNNLGSFVFETSIMPPKWLGRHGVLVSDTLTASDHFPVVTDFRWREESSD